MRSRRPHARARWCRRRSSTGVCGNADWARRTIVANTRARWYVKSSSIASSRAMSACANPFFLDSVKIRKPRTWRSKRREMSSHQSIIERSIALPRLTSYLSCLQILWWNFNEHGKSLHFLRRAAAVPPNQGKPLSKNLVWRYVARGLALSMGKGQGYPYQAKASTTSSIHSRLADLFSFAGSIPYPGCKTYPCAAIPGQMS